MSPSPAWSTGVLSDFCPAVPVPGWSALHTNARLTSGLVRLSPLRRTLQWLIRSLSVKAKSCSPSPGQCEPPQARIHPGVPALTCLLTVSQHVGSSVSGSCFCPLPVPWDLLRVPAALGAAARAMARALLLPSTRLPSSASPWDLPPGDGHSVMTYSCLCPCPVGTSGHDCLSSRLL